MNKVQKWFLAVSCFFPLYIIFLLKNVLALVPFVCCKCFQWTFWYNLITSIFWILLSVCSIIGIAAFKKLFLHAYQKSNEKVTVLSAENVTKDYYFTYFTLFVLTFFSVNPTYWLDTVIFIFLMMLIWVVYLRNNMFFINPILNIIGYKSFKIKYAKTIPNANEKQFEAYVFTRLNSLKVSEEYFLSFSKYDFTICYDDNHKFKKF